jgi:hypothetical protein
MCIRRLKVRDQLLVKLLLAGTRSHGGVVFSDDIQFAKNLVLRPRIYRTVSGNQMNR